MFKIRKKNNNSSFIVQEIQQLDYDFCELILASDLIGEGVFSIETVKNIDETAHLFITPSFFRENIGVESFSDFSYLKDSTNEVNCYSIIQNNPSFLPIFTENITSLIHNILLIKDNI